MTSAYMRPIHLPKDIPMNNPTNLTDNEFMLFGLAVKAVAAGVTIIAAATVYDTTTTILIRGLLKTGIIKVVE